MRMKRKERKEGEKGDILGGEILLQPTHPPFICNLGVSTA